MCAWGVCRNAARRSGATDQLRNRLSSASMIVALRTGGGQSPATLILPLMRSLRSGDPLNRSSTVNPSLYLPAVHHLAGALPEIRQMP